MFIGMVAVLIGVICFSGACSNSPRPVPYAEKTSGAAVAHGFGGDVTVTVTVEKGKISDVKAAGPDETAGIGGRAITEIPSAMIEANSVKVDTVSGATITSRAILSAAARAYASAIGQPVSAAPVKMVPGTYRASAWAFSPRKKMTVAVTVDSTRILSIEVEDNVDTLQILRSAEDLLIPRIIAAQSVAVDAITGASGSSNGIKGGTILALEQALKAGGAQDSAIENFMVSPAKLVGVTKTLSYDVLVIGMGGSGSAAALSAAETQKAAGKTVSVLAIDKAGKYGGTSAVTSEMMAINPPRFMAAHRNEVAKIQLGTYERPLEDTRRNKNVYVEREVLKQEWTAYTEGDHKDELLDLMLDRSGETLDWLVSHGFFFGLPQLGVEPSASYFLVYQYNGSFLDNKHIIIGYFDQLWSDYLKLGGKYMLETEAYAFITDESGRVIGAKAHGADGTEYIINAKSVVMGTGGFAINGGMTSEYLEETYYPLKGQWNQFGMQQNDGKMIQAAFDIGAGSYNISVAPIVHIGGTRRLMHEFDTATVTVNGEQVPFALNDIPMIFAVSGDAMSVSRLGTRFANEWGLGFLEAWKAGPEFYTICAQDKVNRVRARGFDFITMGSFIDQGGVPLHYPVARVEEAIDAAIRNGIAFKADTLEELAGKIGVDPAVLSDTVQTYNGYCARGVDEDFHKEQMDPGFLVPIGSQGPFYAFVGASYCYSSCGGLDVNSRLQVLKTDGRTPISGLYASGTDCLGTLLSEKKAYVTYGGLAQGWAFTSGKIAGGVAALDAR
jgi:fumarate reductase flavoprotein subunit